MTEDHENTSDCETKNAKAKSEIVARISRIVRRAGLDYDGWRYVAKRVRKECSLQPARKGRRLPKVLTGDDFRRFFEALDRSDDIQHSLMIRLLFFTGMRVSELCNTQVVDVDLEACRIRVEQGKGGKDRTVLFGKSFAVALRTHIAGHPDNRWLFQTRRNTRYSTRRVQQIVASYAEKAGVRATMPSSSRNRRTAQACASSPQSGCVQQVFAQRPGVWYLPSARRCSSTLPSRITNTDTALCRNPR